VSRAELAASVTAAAAVLADFDRAVEGYTRGAAAEPSWGDWARRLAGQVRPVLAAASAVVRPDCPAGTAVLADGRAVLAPADVVLALAALGDAVAWRGQAIGQCAACRPGRTCDAHQGDEGDQAAYRAVARRLGDAR
jgi:hypothetical protein